MKRAPATGVATRPPARLSTFQNAGRILYKCEIPLHSISLHIFRNYVIPLSEWMSPLYPFSIFVVAVVTVPPPVYVYTCNGEICIAIDFEIIWSW